MAASRAEIQRAYRERVAAREGRTLNDRPGRPSTAQHGSTTLYRQGCRCTPCTKAHRLDNAKHKPKRGA